MWMKRMKRKKRKRERMKRGTEKSVTRTPC
jgi:hypothetical protein